MEFAINVWAFVGALVGVLVLGGIGGFFGARWYFQKQLRDNPPVNEKMIRVMLTQMGRKPSEKQVREIMRQMNNQK